MRIDVSFRDGNTRLDIGFKEKIERVNVGFRDLYRVSILDAYTIYDGEYTVTPSQEEQTLQTANKVLKNDVVVREVPMGLATVAQINRLF